MNDAMAKTRLLRSDGLWRIVAPDGGMLPLFAGGHTNPSLDQAHFRARNDNGSETTATFKAAEDTDWSQAVDENVRVRFTVDETAGGDPTNQSWQLQYNLGGAGWNNVDGTSSVVRSSASPNVTDGTATTRQLTAPAGTFQASEFDEVDGTTAALDLAVGNFTEIEYCVQIRSADVSNGNTIQLRVVGSTTNPLDAYTALPTVTVVEPASFAGSDTVSFTEAFTKQIQKLRADTVSFAEGLTKHVGKVVAETVGLTENLDTVRLKLSAVGDAVALTEARLLQVGKTTADTVALAESLTVSTIKSASETVGLTEGFSASKVILSNLSDTLGLTEAFTKFIGALRGESIGLSEALDVQSSGGGPPAFIFKIGVVPVYVAPDPTAIGVVPVTVTTPGIGVVTVHTIDVAFIETGCVPVRLTTPGVGVVPVVEYV